MDIKIDFSGRSLRYTEEEIAVVVDAMRHAPTLTQGRHRDEFERKFAQYQGVAPGSCFTTMNGCAALEMSAQLCRFRPGDEIVVPAHTFTASCYPYIKKGARPVWADVDLQTRVVTAETIAKAVTPRTVAVVVVHLYGYVADMLEISALCRERGLILIEDAAQAIGAEAAGRKAGSFGDMAVFSFHSHKNLTTLGEGGMLYVKDPAQAAVIPALRHNGHCAYAFDRPDYWKPAMGNVALPMLDNEPLMPNNFCLGEVECALGAKMLDRIDSINDEKRARAIRFIDALAAYPELEFHRVPDRRHNYHLLAARMTTGPQMRDDFMRIMAEEKGVKCVVQYIPLNRYDFYRDLGFGRADCPGGETFFDSMISFPFQHWLSEAELEYMLSATGDALARLTGRGVRQS
jgi:dTDP-4-amino-4,6-dideoxygalactose transaminase